MSAEQDTIPDDVMETAKTVVSGFWGKQIGHWTIEEAIARAIYAERLAQRERDAKFVEERLDMDYFLPIAIREAKP